MSCYTIRRVSTETGDVARAHYLQWTNVWGQPAELVRIAAVSCPYGVEVEQVTAGELPLIVGPITQGALNSLRLRTLVPPGGQVTIAVQPNGTEAWHRGQNIEFELVTRRALPDEALRMLEPEFDIRSLTVGELDSLVNRAFSWLQRMRCLRNDLQALDLVVVDSIAVAGVPIAGAPPEDPAAGGDCSE